MARTYASVRGGRRIMKRRKGDYGSKSRGRGISSDGRTQAPMAGSRAWIWISPTYGTEVKLSRTAEKRGWQKYTEKYTTR